MRLRPSGTKGPIATSFEAFTTYQRDAAWTWEHMALTRARVIAGPDDLRARVAGAIRDVLIRARAPDRLAADIADMRARMAREHVASSVWDVKHWRGSLVDIEFIAQYLQLLQAAGRPDVLSTNTRDALRQAHAAGALDDTVSEALLDTLHLCQTVQAVLRVVVEGEFDPQTAPAEIGPLLARTTGAVDFAALESTILERTAAVRAIFDRLLPATAAEPGAPAAS
jgi:glutamate-ammonia-ligase adenylyltransferase